MRAFLALFYIVYVSLFVAAVLIGDVLAGAPGVIVAELLFLAVVLGAVVWVVRRT